MFSNFFDKSSVGFYDGVEAMAAAHLVMNYGVYSAEFPDGQAGHSADVGVIDLDPKKRVEEMQDGAIKERTKYLLAQQVRHPNLTCAEGPS